MRDRHVPIALIAAALAAIGGTLAGTMSLGAAQTDLPATHRAAHARARAAHATARTTARRETSRRETSRLAHVAATRVIRGPRGTRGPRGFAGPAGPAGPQGPAAPPDGIAVPLTVNWFGDGNASQYGTAAPIAVPNIGTLTLQCDLGNQQIVLVPASSAGTATVADVTTLQGEGTNGIASNTQDLSYGASSPITIQLPVNGMLTGSFSVRPDYGAGGPGVSPVSFIFSSYMKLNGAGGAGDECTVAGQLVEHAG